ncbi:Pal [Desulfamplus magnetovallimortis]|uniref:Peptidoglycan-associated lipoprotein n=1 Tax=Desulfamplus magnetovallimortis TaxID=1246637 RepID=A0A1W1HKE0_9BACT|nr:peptidoglycan-associated lipoprotein Pal [Desulfamplus magnetovallimortis]SLM32944.1 Pal [Desulfamplus magnetovallimortis]
MKKQVFKAFCLFIMMAAVVLTFSCAKKTIQSDPSSNGSEISQAEKDARDAALKAEELARQQSAIEEQRLKDEELKNRETAQKKAARELFENKDIYFDYDSSELTPIARMALKEKADWLSENPYAAVTIEGHCDERGTTEYNLALGEKRAISAKNYLQDLGIADNRMSTISYGEEKPQVRGNDEASWAKNRRVHFIIR